MKGSCEPHWGLGLFKEIMPSYKIILIWRLMWSDEVLRCRHSGGRGELRAWEEGARTPLASPAAPRGTRRLTGCRCQGYSGPGFRVWSTDTICIFTALFAGSPAPSSPLPCLLSVPLGVALHSLSRCFSTPTLTLAPAILASLFPAFCSCLPSGGKAAQETHPLHQL